MTADETAHKVTTMKADIADFHFNIDPADDYRTTCQKLAEWLDGGILQLKYPELPAQEQLNKYAEDTANQVFDAYGLFPTAYCMNRLSNVCLLYYIKNKYPGKNNEVNSFHTDRRLKKDRIREKTGFKATTMDHISNKRINPDNYARVNTKELKE